MRYTPVAAVLIALSVSSIASGGQNPNATYVLHAKPALSGGCTVAGQPDCLPGGVMPTVNVDAASEYRVFFYLNNTTCVGAVQTAFQWDTGWTIDPNGELNNWLNCQTNQLNLTTPHGAGGPTDGTITTAFDLITTTFLLIGRMDFLSGPSGCLFQVQSFFQFGNHVVDCESQGDLDDPAVSPLVFGKICVTTGGLDSCSPTPVEPATWGTIKATYR
jgi:hypothetical protein